MKRYLLSIIGLLAFSHVLNAQTLTVQPATGSAPRTLTWNVPNGTNCQAGGDWSGAKANAGTETVSNLAAGTRTFTLTCTVPGPVSKGSATLSWQPATENTDGTQYTNPKGWHVYHGTTNPPATLTVVTDLTKRSLTFPDLNAGRWYFMIRSLNAQDIAGPFSPIVTKDVVDAPTTQPWTGTAQTEVTQAIPKAPVLTVQ